MRYPVRLDIVEDATPYYCWTRRSGIQRHGIAWTSPDTTGYGAGPVSGRCKVNVVETIPRADGLPLLEQNSPALPNDEVSLYGEVADLNRTSGFSPDGIGLASRRL